jgi:quinol monooxygenase YgiN
MIVVVGRVISDGEKREELIRVGHTMAAASRREAGCISYRLYEDTEVEDEFLFVEEWEDDAALKEHFTTPHTRDFMRAIQPTLVSPADVKFHTIERSIDLSQVGGG